MSATERQATVHATVSVRSPIDRAFQVFTERCHTWWPSGYRLGSAERIDVVLEPRVGGRWYERTADGAVCDWGRVLVWHPPDRVALSWQIAVGFTPEPDPRRASRVDITFEEQDAARTIVSVVHSELERHGERWEAMRDGVSNERGWPGILPAYAAAAEADAQQP